MRVTVKSNTSVSDSVLEQMNNEKKNDMIGKEYQVKSVEIDGFFFKPEDLELIPELDSKSDKEAIKELKSSIEMWRSLSNLLAKQISESIEKMELS